MAKDRRSKDQKRKAKLAARRKAHPALHVTPYEGDTYRKPGWNQHVFRTELGIYETMMLAAGSLTNDTVRDALVRLVRDLRGGGPATLQDGELDVSFDLGQVTDFLVWNTRRNWTLLFGEAGPVATDDLIGILRTLLYSIQAHAWNTGSQRGYLAFLKSFIEEGTNGQPEEVEGSILPPREAGVPLVWSDEP
jgi:hypothetical protein